MLYVVNVCGRSRDERSKAKRASPHCACRASDVASRNAVLASATLGSWVASSDGAVVCASAIRAVPPTSTAASASARHVWHASERVASERNVFNQASGAFLVRFRCIGVTCLGACVQFGLGAMRRRQAHLSCRFCLFEVLGGSRLRVGV